ncbi:hypothetical protein, partial [Psychrobacter sp. AOP31-E1-50]|uniref:hypothetical protein n=1 Tax=Psychrobacter sp. AOP31-E1-50 TaxID=3457692 RepID=UPI004035D99B
GGRQTGKAGLIAHGNNGGLFRGAQFILRSLAHDVTPFITIHVTCAVPAPIGADANANFNTGKVKSGS